MHRPFPILGKPISPTEHHIVIGAGISGLFLGFFLKEAGVSFEIWEKTSAPGGILGTTKGANGRAERGANGILWCKEMDYLCDKLEIEPLQANLVDKKRFLVRNGKLRQFPLSIMETIAMIGRLLVPHKGDFNTVSDFGNTYLGKAVNAQILSPALSGIYGTSADNLSFEGGAKMIAEALSYSRWLPLGVLRYRKANKKSPSKRKGLHSFIGGMQTLVDALKTHLIDHIVYDKSIEQVDRETPTILTVPSYVVQQMIPDVGISNIMQSIEYQGVICANLIFSKSQFLRFETGFGCLIPRGEGIKSLGVLFTSVIFPERVDNADHISLRCILHMDQSTKNLSDKELQDLMCKDLDKLFGLSGQPIEMVITRWSHGLPIYSPGLHDALPKLDKTLKSTLPNLRLFGNYTGEISVRENLKAIESPTL